MIRALGMLGCLLLVTACGAHGSPSSMDTSSNQGDNMQTLTLKQAAERADEHVKRAVAALPVEPSLRPLDVGNSPLECKDPTDNGPPGRYEVGTTYWLEDIPKSRNTEFINILYRHWTHNNYRILADDRSRDDKFISVEHNEDAFRMSVQLSDQGDLSLGASSPCVWPDGTPPPSTGQ